MQSIHLVLGRSNYLANLFFLLHAGAYLMLLWVLIDNHAAILFYLFGTLIICLSWYNCHIKHVVKTSPCAVIELMYFPIENQWQITFFNKQQVFAKLSSDSVLTFGISLLKFKQEGHYLYKSVLITKDVIGQEKFRLLRKWWRQYGQTSASI
ncbi:MAG: protein YgfX [Gammaproteobacteria bacterium]